ncbi:hypothetical protein CBW53_09920 [Yersinia frederiksenii]|nr:hypothetical protein CBW53_09920 [Yersinia frederiksenii]
MPRVEIKKKHLALSKVLLIDEYNLSIIVRIIIRPAFIISCSENGELYLSLTVIRCDNGAINCPVAEYVDALKHRLQFDEAKAIIGRMRRIASRHVQN